MKRLEHEMDKMTEEGWYYEVSWPHVILTRWANHSQLRIRLNIKKPRLVVTRSKIGKIISDLHDEYSYVKDLNIQGTPDRYRIEILDKIFRSKGISRTWSVG